MGAKRAVPDSTLDARLRSVELALAEVQATLAALRAGGVVEVRPYLCPACNGSGLVPAYTPNGIEACPTCDGRRVVVVRDGKVRPG